MRTFLKSIMKSIMAGGLLLLAATATTHAKSAHGYSDARPLLIVSDWDFRPFEFMNSAGEPSGYNVEVLDMILDRLGIPHRFVMQEWHTATMMFERHEADLIHALSSNYNHQPYYVTKKYVNYYNLRLARRLDTPGLFSVRDLNSRDRLGLKKDDYATLYFHNLKQPLPCRMEMCSPKDGLTELRRGHIDYYIWGEVPLANKLKELGIDSIALEEIDIPPGELHIVGHDKALVELIDDQYTRMEQAGELQVVFDKWFRPERVHDNASPLTLYILGGLLVAAAIVFLLYRLVNVRVRAAVRRSTDLNRIMTQALNMGEYYVIQYDIVTRMVVNVYGQLMPKDGMHIDEFTRRITPDERAGFLEKLQRMENGDTRMWTMRNHWDAGYGGQPLWKVLYGQVIIESDANGPRYMVNTLKDITRETDEEQRTAEMGSRYKKIFDTGMMAVSFFDAQGRLVDSNSKMDELCGSDVDPSLQHYYTETLLFDYPLLKGVFLPGCRDTFHVCQMLDGPAGHTSKYIEFCIQPVFDKADRLVYYVVTCRDISAERDMYCKQREHDLQLQRTNSTISRYEQRLHYLLKECNMYVWNLDLQAQRIDFSRSLQKTDHSESVADYIESLCEDNREQARAVMAEKVRSGQPFTAIHHFRYTPVNTAPCWFAISGLPLKEKDGTVKHYFGLIRDITYMMEVQQKLREETDRAEHSGMLKSAFLANMTHEIRTPLNAIVGFSGLLQMIDTPDDRKEFIRIIRNNCDMLLRLINDILEASNMGQSMTIEPEEIDFAPVFDDICQTLEQRVSESGVPFQKDNPYQSLVVTLDKGRVQQILTNFVTNAVKYTKQGHIRVGYRQEPGELYFYCEDTGTGIPKDKQEAVFERFVKLNDYVQGTGLGLSICKAIVEKCGGRIGVDSEVGKGSTFWFRIPCQQS